MKPQTKKYLLFFLIAFLAFRLPSIITPLAQEFLLKRFVDLAEDNGIGIGVTELNYESIRILNTKGVTVKIKDKTNLIQSYQIESLRTEFKSFFPPKIDLYSSAYSGKLDCTVTSKSILNLLRENSALISCSVTDFNLQLFPLSGALNILGKVQLTLDLKLSGDPNKTIGDLVIRISEGYIDTNKIMRSPLLKIPPITQIDLYATGHYANTQLKFEDLGFRSNLGLIKGEGEIQFSPDIRQVMNLKTEGTFELTGEGQELITPWIPLINHGKKIDSAKGFFNVEGAPYRLKVDISDAKSP